MTKESSSQDKDALDPLLKKNSSSSQYNNNFPSLYSEFIELKEQNEELYLFNSLPLIDINQNYLMESVNFQAAQLLNQNRYLLMNSSLLNFITLNSKSTFEKKIKASFEKQLIQNCELELIQKGGVRKFVIMECKPGRNNLILLSFKDITYLRQLEFRVSQLNKSLESATGLLNRVTDAIALINSDFYFKIINPSFKELFSKLFSKKIQVGMNFLLHVSDIKKYNDKVIKACHNAFLGEETVINIESESTNASYYFYELQIKHVSDEQNKTDIILHIRDHTAQRLQKNKKLRQQAELAHAARLNTMGELASALAHEINQPLTSISLYSQSCLIKLNQKNKSLKKEQLFPLKQIAKQASLAGKIVHQMSNFMRDGALQPEETNLNDLIHEAFFLIHYEVLNKNFNVNLILDDELPDAPIDRIKIMQVLLNLARNSIEAAQKSEGITPEITVTTDFTDESIIAHFRDNGPGIPPDYHDKILHSYFTTKPYGTGLGLAICRSLIEAHGGKLNVRQHNERGAWFTFTLPRTIESSTVQHIRKHPSRDREG